MPPLPAMVYAAAGGADVRAAVIEIHPKVAAAANGTAEAGDGNLAAAGRCHIAAERNAFVVSASAIARARDGDRAARTDRGRAACHNSIIVVIAAGTAAAADGDAATRCNGTPDLDAEVGAA